MRILTMSTTLPFINRQSRILLTFSGHNQNKSHVWPSTLAMTTVCDQRRHCHLNPSSVNIIKLKPASESQWTSHIRPMIPVHTNFPEVPGEKEMNCLKIKPDLTSKYRALVDHFRTKTSGSLIDPSGVFANNELDLSEIDVYGFDYDYTLAVYKESLHDLIYNLARDALVEKYGFPEQIKNLNYIPDFAIRGLHFDIEHGLLMKLDSFHQIQLGSVFHGLTPVNDDKVLAIYNGPYIPKTKIRGSSDVLQMKQANDLFSVPEICLISQVSEFFESNNITYHPEMLFFDVQSAVSSIHPVIHGVINEETISSYLERNESLNIFMEKLKKAGKSTFLITNSPFKFVDVGMKYMMGSDWTSKFDVIVAQARKPTFFTQRGKCKPFRRLDPKTGYKYWEAVTKLEPGMIYLEGTVNQLLQLTGWKGMSILYFGDQIYADLADITLFHGWRTGAIINELETEINTLNDDSFREAISRLQAIEIMIDEEQQLNPSEDLTDALLKDRELYRQRTKSMFNSNFGSLFRTHHNPTYFSRRLFRYSDIYMSKLTNLLNYSQNHIFCPRRGALPHEKMTMRTEFIEGDE